MLSATFDIATMRCDLVEDLPVTSEHGRLTGEGLSAPHHDVGVPGVDVHR
jgi:hypothetical protein